MDTINSRNDHWGFVDPCQVDKVLADCEIVYNFAALADLNEGTKKPVETIKVNVLVIPTLWMLV